MTHRVKKNTPTIETLFKMVTWKGQNITELEKAIAESVEHHPFTPNECRYDKKGKPFDINHKLWKKALKLEKQAMSKANEICPGCIYKNNKTLTEIIRMTAIAAQSLDNIKVLNAKCWLQKVCIPRALNTDRVHLAIVHLGVFYMLYEQVVLVRRFNEFISKRNGFGLQITKETFPDLASLNGVTPWNRKREQWINVVCRIPDDNGHTYTETKAAHRILADVLGYKESIIQHALLNMHGLKYHQEQLSSCKHNALCRLESLRDRLS